MATISYLDLFIYLYFGYVTTLNFYLPWISYILFKKYNINIISYLLLFIYFYFASVTTINCY